MRTSKIFVTVDIVVFRKKHSELQLLLIKRKNEPFKGNWALPGGFVDENEALDTAAKRELFEETCVKVDQVEQLKAFGKPGRDPRSHTVSVAFIAHVDENTTAVAADDAAEADWFDTNDLPALAFDHADIINEALLKIKP